MRGERVFATLNMLFFRRALSLLEVVTRFLPELRRAAELIASRLGPEDQPLAAGHPVAEVQIPEPERLSHAVSAGCSAPPRSRMAKSGERG